MKAKTLVKELTTLILTKKQECMNLAPENEDTRKVAYFNEEY